MFHKVTGATGVLLFYSFLKEAKITIKPNEKPVQCKLLLVNEMDDNIITSAKKIIAEKSKEDKIESLEAKLDAMGKLLLTMDKKLSQLTA